MKYWHSIFLVFFSPSVYKYWWTCWTSSHLKLVYFSMRSALNISGWMSSRSIQIYKLRVKKKQERSNDNISYSPKFKKLVYTKIFYLHLFFELASSNLMIIWFALRWDIFSKHWFEEYFYKIFGNDDVQPFMSRPDDRLSKGQCLFL